MAMGVLLASHLAAADPENPIAFSAGEPALDARVVAVLERSPKHPCEIVDDDSRDARAIAFDRRGRLVALGSGSDAWKLAPHYDAAGRLAAETLSHGTFSVAYAYRYDATGRLLASVATETGAVTTELQLAYTGGRVTSYTERHACCGTYAAKLAYDRAGRLADVRIAGHPPSLIALGYDTAGRLTSIARRHTDGDAADEVSLEYEADRVQAIGARGKRFVLRYTCS
jgi:YD repeat-containing protein